MSNEYSHGSFATERKTKLLGVLSAGANLSFVVGTAPINLTDENNVNELVRLQNQTEAVEKFGFSDDFESYTLSEALDVFFKKYQVAPVYFVNVLDPKKHKKEAAAETNKFVNDQIVLTQLGALKSSVVVKVVPANGKGDALELDAEKDYSLVFNDDNRLVIVRNPDGAIKPTDSLTVTYSVLDPSLVTAKDIIGGVDAQGNSSGIELANRAYPKYNEILGSLIAPKYSRDLGVTSALLATAKKLNVKYVANALVDFDTSKMTTYADAVAIKQKAGLIDANLNILVGDLVSNGKRINQSTHLAALKQTIAALNDGIPNKNPSNKIYVGVTGFQLNGTDLYLDESQAEYLNKNGLIVSINNVAGWLCWGNRTAAFPASSDIKDTDIAIRDMFNWLRNTCIITTRQMVDESIDRALVLRIENTLQSWLDGLVGIGKLISGSIQFPKELNPESELIKGNIRFLLKFTSGPTASSITTEIEFNVNDLVKMFG